MRLPNFVHADDLKNNCATVLINGDYCNAKPYGLYGINLKRRAYLAWSVFIGRYDVLFYEEDRQKMGRK